jgi:hypothetical protein
MNSLFTGSPARGMRTIACFVAFLVTIFGFHRSSAQSIHASLNWSATYRWVHVDNIAAGRSDVFEAARRNWLQKLRVGGAALADGRPLFWEHRVKDKSTYYTFYPFDRYEELDVRREAILATQRVVGKGAVDLYDSADSVLVPPHYSQIWRRVPSLDYIPTGVDSLTERTSTCGWIEFQHPAFGAGNEIDSLWKEIVTALSAEHYPIECRSFQNVYGNSELTRMWLAPNDAVLRATQPMRTVIERHLGVARAREIFAKLDIILTTTSSEHVERRTDLSNLGK